MEEKEVTEVVKSFEGYVDQYGDGAVLVTRPPRHCDGCTKKYCLNLGESFYVKTYDMTKELGPYWFANRVRNEGYRFFVPISAFESEEEYFEELKEILEHVNWCIGRGRNACLVPMYKVNRMTH